MSIMSIDEYGIFCNDFFNKEELSSVSNIEKTVLSLKISDYKDWHNKLCQNYYDQKYFVIKDLVKQIRGNYDYSTAKEDEEDPIKTKQNQALLNSYKDIYNHVFDKNLEQLRIIQEKNQEVQLYIKQQMYEESLNITINGIQLKALDKCDVLWKGWECDSDVWLVQHDGINKLVASNHGSKYFADASFLEEKIKEYERVIAKSKEFLNLIK